MKFFRDLRAGISIEATGIFLIFTILIILASDTGSLVVAQNRLEATSYSLASIIRERSKIFDTKELNDNEVNELFSVAKEFLKDANYPLGMVVEVLKFGKDDESKKEFRAGSLECKLDIQIDDLKDISFAPRYANKISLYRVTLCADVGSKFKPLKALAEKLIKPIASSVVFAR